MTQLAGSSAWAGSGMDDASDEGMDWEEIAPHPAGSQLTYHAPPNQNPDKEDQAGPPEVAMGNIEITLQKLPKADPKRKKQAEQNAEPRILRLACHKIHTVALLANAIIRNRWLNDTLLHARLLSLAPMSLQTSFAAITKKRHPDAAKRGRLFESAMMRLTQWWHEFFEIENAGHIRSRTFDEVQDILFEVDPEGNEGEVIKGPKSLMKHGLKRRGSRDVSAQLFTALCRALGIPARLVVSLQSVPWKASVGKPKRSKKRLPKGRDASSNALSQGSDAIDVEADDEGMEEVSLSMLSGGGNELETGVELTGEDELISGASTPGSKGKERTLPSPVAKSQKLKSSGQRSGGKSYPRRDVLATTIGGSPPVFWTEVFSRPDGRWIPVDPTRYIVNKRKVFEPSPQDRSNRMVYVVAVEEDGFCRDVTARYARDYGTKTSKAQLGGKERKEWWQSVMALVTRPYRLVRDDAEDEEFEYLKYIEGMPTSIAGFKNHPLYVLEQHLKREEVIFPKTEVGKFRGEAVYPRSNVIPLKTAENWMRVGKRVKEGAQAMKWVKQRAVTIHRRRAVELAQQEGDDVLQGLYSEDQTELYVPDPVVDGIVPKNDFGNLDLYTPSMLPKGGAHIPYKRTAKIANKLGFDYAEAVTGFEFKKGRAFPIVSGIVIAAENKGLLLEAYWQAEQEAEEKERAKRRERILKRWSRLIQGLRIRQRLQEQYTDGVHTSTSVLRDSREMKSEIEQLGGFLTDADRVIQPFHLPRFEHSAYQPPQEVMTGPGEIGTHADSLSSAESGYSDPSVTLLEDKYVVSDTTVKESVAPTEGQAPKSMLELAREMETNQVGRSSTIVNNQSLVGKDERAAATQLNKRVAAKRPHRKETPGSKKSRRRSSARKRTGTAFLASTPVVSDNDTDDRHSFESQAKGESLRTAPSRLAPSQRRSKRISVASSSSTRVLRTRVSKTEQRMREEREAFHSAIAN